MSNLLANTINGKTLFTGIKMIVCDMAGTTINEGGLVYKTLYNTMNNFNLDVEKQDIQYWYGSNKYEVLEHYLRKSTKLSGNNYLNVRQNLFEEFDNNLKSVYFSSSKIQLINHNLPTLFNDIRKSGIKIALNTGYNKDIQSTIIQNLHMNEFIDDYISSEEVPQGRPYPYMIESLIDRNDILNSRSVIKIGDSKNDILEGINAKCCTSLGVLSGADEIDTLGMYTVDIMENIMSLELI